MENTKMINLTQEEIKNLMTFLNRVTVTGINEVSVLHDLVIKILKEEEIIEKIKSKI